MRISAAEANGAARRLGREQEIEDGAQAVDVALRVDLLALAPGLLRRHVAGGPQHADAPVHHERLAEVADHHVLGFQVAMQQAALVRERDGLAQALEHPQQRTQLGPLARVLVEPCALHELHHVEDAPVGERPDVVHGHDAGVLEARQHARLRAQPLGQLVARPRAASSP